MSKIAVSVVVALLATLSIGQDPCPNWKPIDPNTCPFIDKTKIVGVYIGYIETPTNSRTIVNSPTCDPEGMSMIATPISIPAGMIVQADANDWLSVEWKPKLTQAGVHYIVIKVTDQSPMTGLDAASITATKVWRVVPRNEPPQVGGCRVVNQ
jgi:hypothetical protein